jgi:xanthine dehydrogenase accessory factor
MLCVIRGGGDLATGVAWRLTRAGVEVVVTELPEPLTVRRTVALSSAVRDGEISVEGMVGRLVETADEAVEVARSGDVAVLVSPGLPVFGPEVIVDVVVDARLAKRNIDTAVDDAPLVVALGPGFEAGVDCHAVVETQRGHHLGRVLWTGSAIANTGTPGVVGGRGAERVLRAPTEGTIRWASEIGEIVAEDDILGHVGAAPVSAPFDGLVRGLIHDGTTVPANLKIGDVDPRTGRAMCTEISDKALAIGGGVAEAVLSWPR